jgi:dTMP kinase
LTDKEKTISEQANKCAVERPGSGVTTMLVTFEGIDGCGKSTQISKVFNTLISGGADCKTLSFPRYGEPSSTLVKMYLNGDLGGTPDAVNAFAASSFYAVDRVSSYLREWRGDYDRGALLLFDRYSGSNAIHQGAKLSGTERTEFFSWLAEFEFGKLVLPKPDLTLFFKIAPELALARIASRGRVADIHERDSDYLYKCAESAVEAAEYFKWRTIDANRDIEDVFAEVMEVINAKCQ